jgi:hypothetical protein
MSEEVCHIILTFSNTYLKLTHDYIQTGAQALAGEEECNGVKLFPAVGNERKITGRGNSIIIYDPNTPMNAPPYWEHYSTTVDATGTISARYRVRVIEAFVQQG